LEFQTEETGPGRLRVTVPPHRLDVHGSADLIEELVRIHGYDRLPATLLHDQLPEQVGNRSLELEEHVRDLLVNVGLQEIITYSLTEPSRETPLVASQTEYVRLANPISSERVGMRQSLLASVLEIASSNLKHTEDIRLFEIGAVYLLRPGQELPEEPKRLAIVMTGKPAAEFWEDGGKPGRELNFFDLKGVIESLTADLHLAEVSYRPSTIGHLHPGRAAELLLASQSIGHFGQLHPKVATHYGLGDRSVLVAELDLEAILAKVLERFRFVPVPRFPSALRDIAVIVAETVSAEQVMAEIRAAGGDLLSDIRLFDLYKGESIPAGTKSLAFAISYQASDRTLTDKEVDKAHKKIEERLTRMLKAQVRGKE
jgi:phenylalanyl-tRNA synthetase beta chain